jgi:hypothetical protein
MKTVTKTCETLQATIYLAGPIDVAKQVVREYCMTGLCVTIEPTTYIYTMGEEEGYRVGLINYPRFPTTARALHETAMALAYCLMEATHQGSFTVASSLRTEFVSRRPQDVTAG